MSWMDQIKPDSGIWHGVEAYANTRIQEMTAVCVNLGASDQEIRAAQARIDELQRLLSVPSMIKATAAQRQTSDQRRGY